jgi:hypothetical protein
MGPEAGLDELNTPRTASRAITTTTTTTTAPIAM